MTFSIRIANANFTNYVTESLPHANLAKMFLLFGGDSTKSIQNYAGDRRPAVVIGAPTFPAAGYALLSEANGFEGADVESGSPFTHIMVATQASATVGYCGNWTTGKSANMLSRQGVNLNLAVDGGLRADVGFNSAGFHFLAGSHDGAVAKVYKGVAGALNSVSAALAGGSVTKSKFRAGANNYSAGTFTAAAVATFGAALTDQQVADVYAYLKKALANRGITVA